MRYTATYLFVFLFAASLVYIWILRVRINGYKRQVLRMEERRVSIIARHEARAMGIAEVIEDLHQKLTHAYLSLETVLKGCQSDIKGVEAEIGPDGLSGVSYEFHTYQDKEEANS